MQSLIYMTNQKFFPFLGMIVLLAFLAVPGVFAAETTQPGYITVGIQPVAQFEAYYAFATVPTKVMFVDSSLGSTPMTYQWDFGDGSTSTEQNPTHMYISRGLYTVTLTVKNAYGMSTAIKKDYISIGMAPRADFSGSPTTGTTPVAVKFMDLSKGQVATWLWDFGDGLRSTEQNPAHTYWTNGVYNVILTVSNEFGQDYTVKNNYITVAANLQSKFTANPSVGNAPLVVKFTDTSLGNPKAWSWDFGDGATSTEQNPSHTFTSSAVYHVALTVTRDGDSDTSKQTIVIGGVPVAAFVGVPVAANPGDSITFTDASTNNPTSWSWDFGDTATSSNQNPSHSYQIKGIYTISLTAKNNNGKDTETKLNYINIGMGPKADFRPVIVPYKVTQVPLNVQFMDESSGNPTSWLWNFGDQSTSTEQNPAHLYMNAGTYTVSLTVKNSFGTDTVVKKDVVTVGKGPAVDFTANPTTVGIGRVVTFTDLSSNNPTNWVWDFGDGMIATSSKPEHVYLKTGVYDVTLTASNPDNSNSRTKNQYITVLDVPLADFTADKTRGGAPMVVSFTDLSKGSPTTWKWDFGDGSTSLDKNPTHTYTTLGTYTVSLTVTNANGQDTTSKKNLIMATLAPVAEFKADRQLGKAPFVVRFTDLSTNNPTTWSWDFGDGTSSSEQNPQHIYMNEGSYDVRLTVTNQYGSDSVFKTGSSAPVVSAAVPTATPQTPVATVTQAVTIAPTTSATKAPLSPIIMIIALGIIFLAVSIRCRK